MVVGLGSVELRLEWSNSLKDKRREIKSLISRVRSRFNVSIAETEQQEQWKKAVLSFAAVSSERRHADSMLNEVIRFIERSTEAELVSYKTEII
ncbi:MAG: DUF503 domain-containing protein [Firmicutes bacterium HGW-Firmicutes-14]|nr:MAG: DUF503 domain-containing protein [Firmicutes bacterium HGW-Firmicutes-14]